MTGADNHGSFLYRISIRRNQFAPMDTSHDQELEDLELLQKHVADRFSELLTTGKSIAAASGIPNPNSHDSTTAASESAPSENEEASGHDALPTPRPPAILSIAWLRKLLDTFLCCEAEFKAVLISGRDPSQFSKPPLDRLIPDLLDRFVKALDICNSVNHGIDLVQHWQKVSEIAVTALRQTPLGDGQVRRARKALTTLLSSMAFDDKESTSSTFHIRWTERTRSFGRRFVHKDRPSSHNFRSLSWSVAKSWSAAKQIQNMSANLVAPRGAEANGPALSIYIINNVLLFIMWALVAAIPCQDRNGFPVHSQVARNMGWAQPIVALHDKISEDWKKKEKKGTVGLLEEIKKMEKLGHSLAEFADGLVFPMEEEEKKAKLERMVAEMAEICGKMEEELASLQQQVREVFHKIVRSRAEILEVVDQVNKTPTPVPY